MVSYILFFFRNLINKMSNQLNAEKIPLHLLDEVNLQSVFSKSSMQIFHSNQIRLAELLQQINSLYSSNRVREVMVKIFSVFEQLKVIFFRLGLIDLFQQLKLIVNAISKLVLLYQPKLNGRQSKKNEEKIQKAQKQINKQTVEPQTQQNTCANRNKSKNKRLRGIFLYNESYNKNIEPRQPHVKQQQLNVKKLQQQFDKQEQLQKQQMWFYIERKKDLSQIKAKDHSKNYKQIQNQFKVVEERLIHALEGLHIQINHENIKQSQYLSRQQINSQLYEFNTSMRTQLLGLKNHYDAIRQNLVNKNKQLSSRLEEQLNKRNLMVSTEVQTIESISSYKKTKKICDQFQYRIRRLQEKNTILKTNLVQIEQIRQKLQTEIKSKTKQLDQANINSVLKEKTIEQLNQQCKNLKQLVSELQFNHNYDSMWKNMKSQKKFNFNFEEDTQSIKKRKGLLNKFNSKDRSIKIASKKQFVSTKKIIEQIEQSLGTVKDLMQINDNKQSKKYLGSITLIEPRINANLYLNQISTNDANANGQTKNLLSLKRNSNRNNIQSTRKQQNQSKNSSSYSKEKSSVDHKKSKKISGLLNQKLNQLNEMKKSKEKKGSNYSNLKGSMAKQNEADAKQVSRKQERNSKTSSSFYRPSVLIRDQITNQLSLHHQKKKQSFILKKGNFRSAKNKIERSQNSLSSFDTLNPYSPHKDMQLVIDQKLLNLGNQHPQRRIKLSNVSTLNKTLQIQQQKIQQQNEQLKNLTSQYSQETQQKENYRKKSCEQYKKIKFKQIGNLNLTKTISNQLLKMNQLSDKQKEQVLNLSLCILKTDRITQDLLTELAQKYPQIISGLKQPEFRDKIFKQLTRFHEMKCKKNNCRHLQAFVQFCYKTQFNCGKRQAMKLPVQDFSKI